MIDIKTDIIHGLLRYMSKRTGVNFDMDFIPDIQTVIIKGSKWDPATNDVFRVCKSVSHQDIIVSGQELEDNIEQILYEIDQVIPNKNYRGGEES